MKQTVKTSRTAGYLEKMFRAMNDRYFNDLLEEPIVTIQSTPRAYGHVSKVVEQSHLNTWFASHSYALTNSARPQSATVKAFTRHGIGLYGKGTHFQKIIEAKPYALPSSYMSFQFNEWIGKAIVRQGGLVNA